MNTYKIIFDNGDHEYTRFNGSIDTVKQYYIGHVFNIGVYEDVLVKCVAIEEA